jgi:hypothetical protein
LTMSRRKRSESARWSVPRLGSRRVNHQNRCVDPVEYVRGAVEKMRADGSAVSEVVLGHHAASVGYQSKFRLRWAATKLHLFTVLVPVTVATESDMRMLISESLNYAKATKGKLRGFQSGVAVIPVLVASTVEPQARTVAESPPDRRWSAFTRPTIIDVATSQTYTYTGRQMWGGFYNAWIRARLAVVSPDAPASAAKR